MQYEYDATQDKCPLALVKTRLMLKKLQQGDSCIVRIADSGSKNDIPRLLKKQGYPFTETKINSSVIELHIKNR